MYFTARVGIWNNLSFEELLEEGQETLGMHGVNKNIHASGLFVFNKLAYQNKEPVCPSMRSNF